MNFKTENSYLNFASVHSYQEEKGGLEKIRRTKPKKGIDKVREKDKNDYSKQREKKRNYDVV